MQGRIKSFLSVLLLAVFLFPSIVQNAHSVHHEKIFSCDAKGAKHLHTQSHDCSLCDFVLPVVVSSSNAHNDFSLFSYAETIFAQQADVYFSSSRLSFPSLRAPPVIS